MCFRKRILSFVIDIIIFMGIFLIINIIPFYDDYIMSSNNFDRRYYIVYSISLLAIFIAFIAKDAVGGQSIGKRIMKIKVISIKGTYLSAWRLLIRNLTFFIWPIEALLMFADKKRLGDRIAGTDVAEK